MASRLAGATSAYLRSAAHQPVDWHPWGEAAFAEAARLDRPVLLDIGAAWCHWCHVMDGESYEDPALADFLNRHFVCLKVDRDERPDVDARYQRAVQAMTGQGGWPLTVFLTPGGQPFYGGTYFPPDGRHGRPGFRSLLAHVLTVYRERREEVEEQTVTLRRLLEEHLDETAPGEPAAGRLEEAAFGMRRVHDPVHGGFGSQPKFPHPGAVRFLLDRWRDTGDRDCLATAGRTLLGMAHGGIHDHLGGGFHRYSVDARWVVPHFEKMSYDNAELLRAFVDGYAALGDPALLAAARGIVRWVREVLADPEGGYGASQDADVGLEDDGDYFTWTLDEAREAIGDPAVLEVAAACYDIGMTGEMHHHPAKNVLFEAEPVEAVAVRLGLSAETARERLALGVERLREARGRRPAPAVDRTRYTGWNGMLAGALIRASTPLENPWALEHGLRTLARIRREQSGDDTALRHAPDGPGGLLDDQVQVALAAVEAYEATGDHAWLSWSEALLDRVWQEYRETGGGGLFDTTATGGPGLLPARARPVLDAPTPSPNGVAALVAARLDGLTGQTKWRERRDELVAAFAGAAPALGVHGATILQAMDWAVNPATHLVIVEDTDAGLADAMHREALRTQCPRRVVQRVRAGSATSGLPAAVQGMLGAASGTRGYVCAGTRCQAPTTTLEAWIAALRAATSPPGAG